MNLVDQAFLESAARYPEFSALATHHRELLLHLPERLSLVREFFPHYTDHGAGHSERVLNLICKMLGRKKLWDLPPADLWLLSAAAWYHDLGMALSLEDKTELLRSAAFRRAIKAIQEDPAHPLYKYARLFDVSGERLLCTAHEVTVESINALHYLTADFVRRDHASRSAVKVQTDSRLNLAFPFIPPRLVGLLSKICAAHGEPREYLLTLPACEFSGIGDADCHPALTASLLRLGDLLDLDATRVPRELIATLGSLPDDSIAHLHSGSSITHFELSPDLIALEAACPDDKTLEVLNDWLAVLSAEHEYQSRHWHRLCPSKDLCTLPALGELNAHLEGSVPLKGKIIPRFAYDEKSVFTLLKGGSLYESPYKAIRELMQNAADAVYLRIFLEREAGRAAARAKSADLPPEPDLDWFVAQCRKYHIEVSIQDDPAGRGGADGCWQVIISDEGLGMDESDLEGLTCVAHGRDNREKYEIIKRMPLWMRPSGIFGIGFQSVFLLTDEVEISTLKYGSGTRYDLKLHNPEKQNFIEVRSQPGDYCFGTTISFLMKPPQSHFSYDLLGNTRHHYTTRMVYRHDVSAGSLLPQQGALAADEARNFALQSWIGCTVSYNGDELTNAAELNSGRFDYFDPQTLLQIRLGDFDPDDSSLWRTTLLYFRNQYVSLASGPQFRFLSFDVNILGYDADQILTVDRAGLQSDKFPRLQEQIRATAFRYVRDRFDTFDDETLRLRASMFFAYYRSAGLLPPDISPQEQTVQNICNYCRHALQRNPDYQVFSRLEQYAAVQIRKIDSSYFNWLRSQVVLTFYERQSQSSEPSVENRPAKFKVKTSITLHPDGSDADFFMLSLLPSRFPSLERLGRGRSMLRAKDTFKESLPWEDEPCLRVRAPAAKRLLAKSYLDYENENRKPRFRRDFCTCPVGYPELRLKTDTRKREFYVTNVYRLPVMYCPFIIDLTKKGEEQLRCEITDELIESTVKNSALTPPPDQDRVRAAYEGFAAEYGPYFEECFADAQRKSKDGRKYG